MRKISVILIIVGVLVGISPIIGQQYTKYQENRMMEEWLGSEDAGAVEEYAEADPEEGYSQLQELFTAEGEAEQEKVGKSDDGANGNAAGEIAEENSASAPEQFDNSEKSSKLTSNQTVLGIIQIKKIKVKAPIVEGVKSSNLKVGVGHIPGTAGLGQPGNSALAGHRSYTFGKFFNRLDELVIGDEILITTKKEDLKYKVYKIHVVTPDDVSVLKGSKDDTIITLITCTPIYVASHRLIVLARLEDRVLKEP